jgi:hypothetical protein
MVLNSNVDVDTEVTRWNNTTPTSSVFSIGTDDTVNASGGSYVAYLFAHDAGGFGVSGSDNVVSCGAYTGNGSAAGPTISLGYEPQWLMIKSSSRNNTEWIMFDSERGIVTNGNDPRLLANSTADENPGIDFLDLTTSGFTLKINDSLVNADSETYIYLAIRKP